MWEGFPLFPDAASTIAKSVDSLFFFLTGVTIFFSSLIFALIFYFAVKYRRRSGHRPLQDPETHPGREGHLGLELLWSVTPLMITLVMFLWGASLFMANSRAPDAALNIEVVGRQWMWKVQHSNGRREINELHVPVGQPVKLTLASQDVIHSFFIPAFRVKQDAVPGRYTTMWFEATKPGVHHLFCAEYCGAQHSGMVGRVVVMEPDEFERWLSGVTEESPVKAGEKLFTDFNCVDCHATGQRQRCPQLGGLFGKEVALAGGGRALFDESYVRESILNPNAKVAAGYSPLMPTYRGQISEEQILQIIAYIRSLSPDGAAF
jgi:cytochrome c oxidase subunit 2